MKKKIIILGSTGSIGEKTFNIIKENKKEFEIILLSTNTNIKKVIKQAREFKVRNILINDYKKYIEAKILYKKLKIKFFNTFESIDKILKNKVIDYSMISIAGLDGLKPTLKLIKYSKNIAIVNKESLICGWSLIEKKIKKYKTNFIPIDSEHFSINSLLQNNKENEIEKVYITASGGPFINYPKKKFNKIKLKDALKHPNWRMGKKITIDSATLMNKVFEVIEAKNIFNLDYNKISILTHPKSYIHAIIKFKNGLIKILVHEPDMRIPIYNSIYLSKRETETQNLNLKILNNLNLKKVDTKKFPLVKLVDKLPNKSSLFETVLLTINDYLVLKFLKKEISFQKLINLINKFSNLREFEKYKKIKPQNEQDIYKLREYVSFKMETFSI
jgi:1-deoxy-D-xylulose-5-phosphate reductoisomerase